MKKYSKFTFPLLCAALAAPAFAFDSSYVTTARVVDSAPIIETVYEPVETCRYEIRRQRPKSRGISDHGDKILGGIIGGAAGSAFGKGSGRDAAAAIGAILGGEIADGDGQLTGGELIGGLAGGLLGNQIGGGSGKTAATAAGALAGSIVGGEIQNGNEAPATATTKKVRVCEVVDKPRKVITGYEVTVEHDGFHFTDVVSRKPGDYLNINVNVEFIDDLTVQSH